MSINRRRSTPRRRDAPQEDRSWWDWANPILFARAHSRCEKCGQPLAGSAERHHRQRRQVGGDRLSNLLLLHPHCHTYVTEHPEEALANGWIVSSYAPDPAAVPVRLPGLTGSALWTLDDEGSRTPVP